MSSLSLPSGKPRKTALQRAIELREFRLQLGMPSLSEEDEFWSTIEKHSDDECWPAAQSQFLYNPKWSPPTGYIEVVPGCWVNPKRLGAQS